MLSLVYVKQVTQILAINITRVLPEYEIEDVAVYLSQRNTERPFLSGVPKMPFPECITGINTVPAFSILFKRGVIGVNCGSGLRIKCCFVV